MLSDLRLFQGALPPRMFKALFEAVVVYRDAFLAAHETMSDPSDSSWFDLSLPPTNLFELALVRLAFCLPPGNRFLGAEWWIRISMPHQDMPWHFDVDLNLVQRSGEISHPAFASVLFLAEHEGQTVVTDQTLIVQRDPQTGQRTKRVRPEHPAEAVFVASKPNHYLIFPGNLRHRVMSAPASEERSRMTFLANWWTGKPECIGRRLLPYQLNTIAQDVVDRQMVDPDLPRLIPAPPVRVDQVEWRNVESHAS